MWNELLENKSIKNNYLFEKLKMINFNIPSLKRASVYNFLKKGYVLINLIIFRIVHFLLVYKQEEISLARQLFLTASWSEIMTWFPKTDIFVFYVTWTTFIDAVTVIPLNLNFLIRNYATKKPEAYHFCPRVFTCSETPFVLNSILIY